MKIEEIRRQRRFSGRSFSGAKVENNQVNPCIREKNPDYVILHVGKNELNSELPPEKIVKSIIDDA